MFDDNVLRKPLLNGIKTKKYNIGNGVSQVLEAPKPEQVDLNRLNRSALPVR
mgnify:CR=1 FL=1